MHSNRSRLATSRVTDWHKIIRVDVSGEFILIGPVPDLEEEDKRLPTRYCLKKFPLSFQMCD
jgi:hypothetical protein